MKLLFSENAWEDYQYWQQTNGAPHGLTRGPTLHNPATSQQTCRDYAVVSARGKTRHSALPNSFSFIPVHARGLLSASLHCRLAEADKKTLKRINLLIREIQRTPYAGIGKPESLRHSLAGYWSRRITGEHRIVYKIENECVFIAQLRYHY